MSEFNPDLTSVEKVRVHCLARFSGKFTARDEKYLNDVRTMFGTMVK
jgi:hypothetical protein